MQQQISDIHKTMVSHFDGFNMSSHDKYLDFFITL